MKLQRNLFLLAIFKVVCCYPSSSESDPQLEKMFGSSEAVHSSVSIPMSYLDDTDLATANHFPDVEYPTEMVEAIAPFYYRAADHDDILEPFTSDVKDSYKSLEAERKAKENSSQPDCSVLPSELDIQHIIKDRDDSQIEEYLMYNTESQKNLTSVVNMSDVSDDSETSNKNEVQAPKDASDVPNVEKLNVESVPADSTENVDTTDDDSSESKLSEEIVSLDSEDEEKISD